MNARVSAINAAEVRADAYGDPEPDFGLDFDLDFDPDFDPDPDSVPGGRLSMASGSFYNAPRS